MTARYVVSHIIDTAEIGLTFCGEVLSWHEATDPTPWAFGRDVAIWPEDDYGDTPCPVCFREFEARS